MRFLSIKFTKSSYVILILNKSPLLSQRYTVVRHQTKQNECTTITLMRDQYLRTLHPASPVLMSSFFRPGRSFAHLITPSDRIGSDTTIEVTPIVFSRVGSYVYCTVMTATLTERVSSYRYFLPVPGWFLHHPSIPHWVLHQ